MGLKRCPYKDCDFEGSEEQVQDHVAYMTGSLVNDRDHQESQLRETRD